MAKQTKLSNPNLPTELKNGNFEGSYSVQLNSGVSSDRAIYVPEGWTVERKGGNENDLTALKDGDLYFSNFFKSRPSPSSNSQQTYWIRQNWGTPTLTLSQELRLPEGRYKLECDVWKSGLGGDAYLSVEIEDGATVMAPTVENKEAWQHMSLEFESDGTASSTIRLTAMHNSNGSEKIIGFDNIVITLLLPDAIERTTSNTTRQHNAVYDLAGRRVHDTSKKGLYIINGRNVLIE